MKPRLSGAVKMFDVHFFVNPSYDAKMAQFLDDLTGRYLGRRRG
jgi:hypothetical protein